MDRGAWQTIVHEVVRVGHDSATKPPIDKKIKHKKHKCVATKPEKELERTTPRREENRLQSLCIYFEKCACTKRVWKNIYHLGIE